MPLPIIVTAYSGYKTDERPKSFLVDEDWFDIPSIEDRWLEPDAEYFKVRSTDGKTYLLLTGSLQSRFHGALKLVCQSAFTRRVGCWK